MTGRFTFIAPEGIARYNHQLRFLSPVLRTRPNLIQYELRLSYIFATGLGRQRGWDQVDPSLMCIGEDDSVHQLVDTFAVEPFCF